MNVQTFLDEMGINYRASHHVAAYTAQDLASVEHVPGRQVIKPVVVRADGQFVMCALPASYRIDLDALRTSRRVTWKLARQNLALLDHYFWLRSSRTDRYRFLKAYLQNRADQAPDVRRFALKIEDATRLWAERLWTRWGRRCRKSNKYFEVYPGSTSWCVASRDLDPTLVRSLLENPDRPFEDPSTRILKNSRTTTVAETTMLVRGTATQIGRAHV